MSTEASTRRWMAWMFERLPGMLTCREADLRLAEHVDGTLPLAERARLRVHLLLCGPCRRYLRAYRRTLELVRETFERETDAGGAGAPPEDLVRAILAARGGEPPR